MRRLTSALASGFVGVSGARTDDVDERAAFPCAGRPAIMSAACFCESFSPLYATVGQLNRLRA